VMPVNPTTTMRTDAEKPANRMGTMPRASVRTARCHGRVRCPKKSGAGAATGPVCGYCKRPAGPHAPKCPRGQTGPSGSARVAGSRTRRLPTRSPTASPTRSPPPCGASSRRAAGKAAELELAAIRKELSA
jgi:hypothetical protein